MDLTLFLIFVIFSFMIYYLILSIQSLILEIREVKQKCINTNNSRIEDFQVKTEDPTSVMKKRLVNVLQHFAPTN